MATSHTADLVGRVLGDRYRLTRRLGQGAFGQVYVADDVTLRRQVAIKVLNPALADERAFIRRFMAEAQAAAGLRHPHILRVYDWGEDLHDPYLVMELLAGGNLRSYLDRGRRLSPSQVTRIGLDIAGALDYAHRRGLVHRDIKPANLIFDDEGRIVLADFGLARALSEATLTEPTGAVIGTARYAAPEQIHGDALDGRADVYSLVLVLVEALTGQVPFAMDTSLATLMRRLREPLTVPRQFGALAEALSAAGTVAAGDRLDAGQLAARLQTVAASSAPPAPLVLPGPPIEDQADDDRHPTEVPGRPRVFDIEAVEAGDQRRGRASIPAGAGPLAPPPPPPSRRDRGGRAPAADGAPQPAAADGRVPALPAAGLAAGVSQAAGIPAAGPEGPAGEPSDQTRRRRRRVWPALALAAAVVAGGGAGGYLVTRPAPTSAVPALRGEAVAAATSALARLHLHLAVIGRSYDATGAPGTVLSQRPRGGRLTQGRTVAVVVSKGPRPVPVPPLANQTLAEATTALARAGLKLGPVGKATSLTVAAGSVISAKPATGTLLPGQPVALVVSTGKPTVVVPTLSGSSAQSYTAAQAALQAVGLPTTEDQEYSNTVTAGQVIVTNPAPGVRVTVGTTVVVEVSKGPEMVTVPNVTGDSVTEATQALSNAGLTASGVNGNPIGTVVSTTPAEGSVVVIGTSVELDTH